MVLRGGVMRAELNVSSDYVILRSAAEVDGGVWERLRSRRLGHVFRLEGRGKCCFAGGVFILRAAPGP